VVYRAVVGGGIDDKVKDILLVKFSLLVQINSVLFEHLLPGVYGSLYESTAHL
jgi:hypothetical protein